MKNFRIISSNKSVVLILMFCLILFSSMIVAQIPSNNSYYIYAENNVNDLVESSENVDLNNNGIEPHSISGHRDIYYPVCEKDNGYKISNSDVSIVYGKIKDTVINGEITSDLTIYDKNNHVYNCAPEKYLLYSDVGGKDRYTAYDNMVEKFAYEDMASNIKFNFQYREDLNEVNHVKIANNDWNKSVFGIAALNGIKIGYGRYAYTMTYPDDKGNIQNSPTVISDEMYKNRNSVEFTVPKFQGDLHITNVYQLYQYTGLWYYWDIRTDYTIQFRVKSDKLSIFDVKTNGEIGREPDQVYYTDNGFRTSLAGDKYGKVTVTKDGTQISEINHVNEKDISFRDNGVYELQYINGYGYESKFTVVIDSGNPQISVGDVLINNAQKIVYNNSEYYYIKNGGSISWTGIRDSISNVKVDGNPVEKGSKIENGIHEIIVNKIGKEYKYYIYVGAFKPDTNYMSLNGSPYNIRKNRYAASYIARLENGNIACNYAEEAQKFILLEERINNAVKNGDHWIYKDKIYYSESDLNVAMWQNVSYKLSRTDFSEDEDYVYYGTRIKTNTLYLNDFLFVKGSTDFYTTEVRYYKISIEQYISGNYNYPDIVSALERKNVNTSAFALNKTMEEQDISDKNGVYFIIEFNAYGDYSDVFTAFYVGDNETYARLYYDTDTEKNLSIDLCGGGFISESITSFKIGDWYNYYDSYAQIQIFRHDDEHYKDIYTVGKDEDTRCYIANTDEEFCIYIVRFVDRNGNIEEFEIEVQRSELAINGVVDMDAYGDVEIVMKASNEIIECYINMELTEFEWVYNSDGTKSVSIKKDDIEKDVVIIYIDSFGEEQIIAFIIHS